MTEILSAYSDFSAVPPDVLERAAERGRRVHRICAALALGLWVPEIPEECRCYVESFRKWLDLVDTVHLVETELADDTYGFVGHPDLVVTLRGEGFARVVDLKTPVVKHRLWRAQIAAYNRLAAPRIVPLRISRSGTLRLSPKGDFPRFDEYSDSAVDFNAFLCALMAYRFFKEVE